MGDDIAGFSPRTQEESKFILAIMDAITRRDLCSFSLISFLHNSNGILIYIWSCIKEDDEFNVILLPCWLHACLSPEFLIKFCKLKQQRRKLNMRKETNKIINNFTELFKQNQKLTNNWKDFKETQKILNKLSKCTIKASTGRASTSGDSPSTSSRNGFKFHARIMWSLS